MRTVTKWARIFIASFVLLPSSRCVPWPPVGSEIGWTPSMAAYHQLSTVLSSVVWLLTLLCPRGPDSDCGAIMWHTWQVIPAGCSLYTDGSLIDARAWVRPGSSWVGLLGGHLLHLTLVANVVAAGVWGGFRGRRYHPRR